MKKNTVVLALSLFLLPLFAFTADNKAALKKKIDKACHDLLSNPVIEEYSFEIK